jgi:hypothetical protein
MTSLQQSKGLKPEVIATVTEDTLERMGQCLGHRLDIRASALQKSSYRNNARKIKAITSIIWKFLCCNIKPYILRSIVTETQNSYLGELFVS